MATTLADHRSPQQVYRDRTGWEMTADRLRCIIAITATVWYSLVFWLCPQRMRDGWPPEPEEIVLVFHVPLAVGLTLAGWLAVHSLDVGRSIGIVCLVVLIPAVVEIVAASFSGGARGAWVYVRG